LAVAGGAEACLTDTYLAAFRGMGALTRTGISRPFDVDRDGFAAGEGAGVLVLEPLDAAQARGARMHLEVLGTGSTSDAHHLTAPRTDGAGAVAAMRLALADAGLTPADVAQVNAHGTSTPLNDVTEARAVAEVLGAHRPPVTSVKGVTGHTLGAAGAVEAVAVALSVRHRLVPPTAGLVDVDPAVAATGVDVVRGEPRPWEPGPVLSTSFGFGGHNAALVLAPVSGS
ncbi:MAG: beta-ketoacyl-[acyl-carrier-protein] synthase family protein, partial [Motilibacteraceae bacterium]